MEANANSPKSYKYATFPRQFLSYRWFKPILVALLTGVFMIVFQVILFLTAYIWSGDPNFANSFGDTYESMNIFTGPGALVEFGGIGVIVPALALATLIVRDRPFSSYSSSRGGWNWGGFVKCLGIAAALMGILTIVQFALSPEDIGAPTVQFSMASLVVCLLLIPLQCLAEEYLFRGFVLQTIGSWTKLPVVAVLVSAAVFAAGHAYNSIGLIAVFINGIVWAVLTLKTRGIEASSAMHIVNNLLCFGLTGFGLTEITSEVDVFSLVIDASTCIAFAVLVIVLDKKFGWFRPKGDGTAEYNERILEKRELKRRRNGMDLPPEQPIRSSIVANAQPTQ